MALPVVLLVGGLWLVCLKARPPRTIGPIVKLRTAGILLIVPLAVALLPWLGALFAPERRSDVPNVLMIVLDTTRVDRLSAYGYGRPTTPVLQRIGAEGMRFDRA